MTEEHMITECMLTTFDNPFDPFEQFDDWFRFDIEKGYNSCSKLDRIANYKEEFTELEIEIEKERAIDTLIRYDFLNVFKKVKRQLRVQ